MLTRSILSRRVCTRPVLSQWIKSTSLGRRGVLTVAIETSCDDTSVAILETQSLRNGDTKAELHFHEKVTANNDAYGGIHPIVALESHQRSLGPLLHKAIQHLPSFSPNDPIPSSSNILFASHDGKLRKKPDFISATRGPGVRSNLSVGLNTAKGLSLAWNIPLIGVHHMQAHALTPRLMTALNSRSPTSLRPSFPFLSLLVSGGHTMLISSTSLINHSILASTPDIALGDCLDKAARRILPPDLLTPPYGRALEKFAFPDATSNPASYSYTPPRTREQELERRSSQWNWSFGAPLGESRGGRSSRRMEYSFSGLLTAVQRATGTVSTPGSSARHAQGIGLEERRAMAQEVQRVAFEHLCGRLLLYLKSLNRAEREKVQTVVVSGGVAANRFLRHVFRSMLDVQGFEGVEVLFPPVEYCTDNAAMIAWAGVEMWNEGYRSGLEIEPIRKWSLDPEAEDGGILGASGWSKTGGR
ncbi:tRNA N6-adenosine threonylcarbamoyltransferase-like protein [Elsinoe australis]|uniref:tRNA N6-adenosine threonylcarbamoyltransferase-like protein n=1 Tax=Elsinoe australis TaxID=40998 RepID=A0A4U7B7L7_9PEZI|nr:tRNA N6-adenosine threonylcarbamoyltransferase-like protein [Elsinoe australis]